MKPMMAGLVMMVVASMVFAAPYYSGTVYTCGFEQGEQGSAFVLGNLLGQGTPGWGEGWVYGNADSSGVVAAGGYNSNQALHLDGFHTSWLNLGEKSFVPWYEFAFKPNFDGLNSADYCRAMTLRGPVGDSIGINIWLENPNTTRDIWINGQVVGHFTNGEWQTLSFEHTVVDYVWGGGLYEKVFTGEFKVYLDGVYNCTLSAGGTYSNIQTMVFRSSAQNWADNGNWYIDNINLSDTSNFVPEPMTMIMLIGGGLLTLRRRK